MKAVTKLSLLLIILIEISFRINCAQELVQIHTLTRHGDRSPCSSYPTDPYRHLWTRGLGQLSNKGIYRLKELGSFLRSYYSDFLPNTFHKDYFYIRSSDMDRTIDSALSAMRTLFRDQIVPVHNVPTFYDYLLKMSSDCPNHKKLLAKEFKSNKYKTVIAEFSSFFKELEKGTGIRNVDIHKAFKICDNIIVWNQLNLPFPKWVNSQSVEKCDRISNLKFIISYSNILLTKFRGGPLITNMVESMVKRSKSFLADKSGMKMIGFFAHDNTIAAFLSHLGSFNQVKPPLASTVIVELYHDAHLTIIDNDPLSQFYVRLLFRNETNSNPHILKLSICNDPKDPMKQDCRLDVLQRSLVSITLKNLPKACGLTHTNAYRFASRDIIHSNGESLVLNNVDKDLISRISEPNTSSNVLLKLIFILLVVAILVVFVWF